MPMNFLQIAGVIYMDPVPFGPTHPGYVRGKIIINENSKHQQVAIIVASGQAATDLLTFSVGDRVLISGHLTVKAHKLEIVVDNIQSNEVVPKVAPLTHHMQFPQMGAAR